MAFQDYSLSPDSNTTIGDTPGTFIGPNMPRDNVRPALQQLAADGRALYDYVVESVDTPDFTAGVTGAVSRTKVAKMRDIMSLTDFGAVTDGVTDNTTAMAAARAWLASLDGGGILEVPTGAYAYATSPNWAVNNSEIRCGPSVFFLHTGSGVAFSLDGGASGDGVYRFSLTGMPVIWGNASTTYGIDLRALHISRITATILNATIAAFRSRFMVSNVLEIQSSGLNFGGQTPQPANGFIFDQRGVNEQTSACTFINCKLSHITGAGMVLTSAVMNNFVGGSAELCDVGCTIGAASAYNTFTNFDMELNTTQDFAVSGVNNVFINTLSDKLCGFAGSNNQIIGGNLNSVLNTGDANSFSSLKYGAGFGTWTDSGTNTYIKAVRSAVSSVLLPDQAGMIGSATYNAPSIAAAGTTTTTVTVTGAAVGDKVTKLSFAVSLAGLMASAYVSAANTVTVVLFNPTAGAIDLASTTVRVEVARS